MVSRPLGRRNQQRRTVVLGAPPTHGRAHNKTGALTSVINTLMSSTLFILTKNGPLSVVHRSASFPFHRLSSSSQADCFVAGMIVTLCMASKYSRLSFAWKQPNQWGWVLGRGHRHKYALASVNVRLPFEWKQPNYWGVGPSNGF